MGVSETSDHIKIHIQPHQELPVFFKAQNQDLMDRDVLCTFKIKIYTQNLKHCVSNTSDHIIIKIKMPNPSQEPPASSKALNQDLKDTDVLCTFKIKIESQNSDHRYIKNQWPYQNQDQDAKPQSGTSSVLQSPQ